MEWAWREGRKKSIRFLLKEKRGSTFGGKGSRNVRGGNGKVGRILRASPENGLGEVAGKDRAVFEPSRRRELLFVLENKGMKRVRNVHVGIGWLGGYIKLFKMV